MILVHLRKKRIKLKEIEITALAGINEANKNGLLSLLESYYKLQIPGVETKESDAEKDAKALLAQETKKIFAVRPALDPARAMKEMSKDPRSISLSQHYMKNKKIFDHKKAMRRGQ